MENNPVYHDCAKTHVTGQSLYIEDIAHIEDELFVGVKASNVAKGRMKHIDLSPLKDLDGPVFIFTAKDFVHNFWGTAIKDQPILVEDRVSYVGQPLLIIAAPTKELLEQAKEAVIVEIEAEEPVLSIDDARKKEMFFNKTVKIETLNSDVKKALNDSAHLITGSFYSEGQEHFYFESQSAITYPGEQGELLIHSSTQHPTEVQHSVANALGLAYNQVICTVKRMGGAFGGKESQATHFALISALVAYKTKKPARIHLSKEEDMLFTGKRHPFYADYRVGFDDSGKIKGAWVSFYADGGAFLDLSEPILQRAMLHFDNAYYLEAACIEGTICRTNYAPNTAFRGFGAPQGVAVIENIIENIAFYLKVDPLKIRLHNLYGKEDRNKTPYGQVIAYNPLGELFDKMIVKSDYENRQKEIATFNLESPCFKRALSITPIKFGISFTLKMLNQGNALVTVQHDGTIQVSTGATEMGQGVNTKIGIIVADCFGVSSDRIKMMPTSTEKSHNTSPTAASTGSDLNGAAALIAANKIRERLALFALYYLSFPEDDKPDPSFKDGEFEFDNKRSARDEVIFEKGNIFLKGSPEKRLDFDSLVKLCYVHRISLGDYGFYKTKGLYFDQQKWQGNPFLYYTNGVCASEIELDFFTGEVRIKRVDILMDLGKSINEGIDKGQIAGAFIQGLGWVTNEQLVYSNDGRLLTNSPTTYKIPNIHDIPEVFNIEFLNNSYSNINVKGSKGVGEPPFLFCLSVFTAIKRAIESVKQKSCDLFIPATGEQILKILNDQ